MMGEVDFPLSVVSCLKIRERELDISEKARQKLRTSISREPPSERDETILIRPDASKKPVNMFGLVFGAFWPNFLFTGVLYFIITLTTSVPPFLIG